MPRFDGLNQSPPSRSSRTLLVSVACVVATCAVFYGVMRDHAVHNKTIPKATPKVTPAARKVRAHPPRESDVRSEMVSDKESARARNNLQAIASINAVLGLEASRAALEMHDRWIPLRNPQTKLYAQQGDRQQWNYRDTAADFFGFEIHAGLRVAPDAMVLIKETLERESKFRTPEGLAYPVETATANRIKVDHDELMFGSSEYVKDGLITIVERYGYELVGERMFDLIDALRESSKREKFLAGKGAEINGNMLQVYSRLSFTERGKDYAESSAAIVDAYLSEAFPANHNLPPQEFDFESGKVVSSALKIADHGNEVVLGFAEAYSMAVARKDDPVWAARAERWAGPIAQMLERIMVIGQRPDGILGSRIHPDKECLVDNRPNDNWGYVIVGALCFNEAARRDGRVAPEQLERIDQLIDKIVARVAKQDATRFTGGMDSIADTLESAIYVAAYSPRHRTQMLRWVDRQMPELYEHLQKPWKPNYLDGNFVRTSLLYAEVCSGGWRAEPFRSDVAVGFAMNKAGHKAVLNCKVNQSWSGSLIPDQNRHRTVLNLPWNWPRLNSWPEWFALTPDWKITRIEGIPPESLRREGNVLRVVLPAGTSFRVEFERVNAAPDSPVAAIVK